MCKLPSIYIAGVESMLSPDKMLECKQGLSCIQSVILEKIN